jgi:hypothetical protein
MPSFSSVGVETDLQVECICCHHVGILQGLNAAQDRSAWTPVPCFFVPGCRGLIYPEAIN